MNTGRIVRIVFLIVGILVLLLSSSIVFLETYHINGGYVTREAGADHPLYWIIVGEAVTLFLIGYFFRKTVNVVLFYVFLGLFIISQILGWIILNANFMNYYTSDISSIGFYITILGFAFIISATGISLHRKKVEMTEGNDDLLDQ